MNSISDVVDKLKQDIDQLPDNIKNMILYDVNYSTIYKNKFHKYIGNSNEIKTIEKELNSYGIDKNKSIYSKCVKSTMNGFDVMILKKGNKIYKEFLGFYTEETILNYMKNNKSFPSFFGNKFLCYSFAKNEWGSVVAFEVTDDIVMIDFFNTANFMKLLQEIKNVDMDHEYFKLAFGYKMSLNEQIKFF
jgi:hypothetical protein